MSDTQEKLLDEIKALLIGAGVKTNKRGYRIPEAVFKLAVQADLDVKTFSGLIGHRKLAATYFLLSRRGYALRGSRRASGTYKPRRTAEDTYKAIQDAIRFLIREEKRIPSVYKVSVRARTSREAVSRHWPDTAVVQGWLKEIVPELHVPELHVPELHVIDPERIVSTAKAVFGTRLVVGTYEVDGQARCDALDTSPNGEVWVPQIERWRDEIETVRLIVETYYQQVAA